MRRTAVRAVLVLGAVGLLWWAERRRPLRRETEPKLRRNARNLAVASLTALMVQTLERPIVGGLISIAHRRRAGLLCRSGLPGWMQDLASLVLFDFALYHWHLLSHRVPLLWRFHQPHHVDLDMDASTALRIHAGDVILSMPPRTLYAVLIGASPRAYQLWQALTLAEIVFHHSNIELPPKAERALSRLIVTPRMHGIHHSIVREEQSSNFSSGLTVWDWLHRTLRLDVPQSAIVIGVPAYRDPEELTLKKTLLMPLQEPRPWRLPDGTAPTRKGVAGGELETSALEPGRRMVHET